MMVNMLHNLNSTLGSEILMNQNTVILRINCHSQSSHLFYKLIQFKSITPVI